MGITRSVGGLPITVRADVVLVVLAVGSLLDDPVLEAWWLVLALASVVLQEIGHAWALRTTGGVGRSLLWAGGGLLATSRLAPRRAVAVHLAGPASGLLVGLPLLALSQRDVAHGTSAEVLSLAALALVGWAAVSALPLLPLDGGQALRAVVGTRRAAALGVVLCAGTAGACLAVGGDLLAVAAVAGLLAAYDVALLLGAVHLPSDCLEPPAVPDAEQRRQRQQVAALAEAVAALRLSLGADALAGLEAGIGADAPAAVRRFARELEGWAALELGDHDLVADRVEQLPVRDPARRALEAALDLAAGVDGAAESVAACLQRDDLRAETARLLVQVVARHGATATVGAALLADGALQAALVLADRLRQDGREHHATEIDDLILGGGSEP